MFVLSTAFSAAAAPVLVAAKSSKLHAASGQLDIPIDVSQPPNGALSIEPRESLGGHTIVATFDATVTSIGVVTISDPTGAPLGLISAPTISGADVTLILTGMPNNTRAVVALSGVNGVTSASFSLGFLVGDVDSSGTIDALDVSGVKARSGQSTGLQSARFDINASGDLNAVDISVVKSHIGMSLPQAGQVSVSVGISGTGSGAVTGAPTSVNCPAVCYANVIVNSTLTLTAVPQTGSTFAGWTGDCSGTNPVVMLNVVRSSRCDAAFTINSYLVTPTSGPNGTLSPSTPQLVNHGQRATFNAVPSVGYIATFGGTCGGSVGSNSYLTNPIVAACTVTAAFSPAFSPIVLYTDITSGPITGGENNKGIYLSIFGKNFGSSGLGSTVRVFINDVEVDNYRYFGVSRGRQDIQQITVQVGGLGNAPMGAPLPITVRVNGVSSNSDVTFTPLPGNIFFVNNVSGVDTTNTSTGGSFSSPFRSVQLAAGLTTSFTISPASTSGAWGRVRAGDFIVLRGTGTPYSSQGFNKYFLKLENKSGCQIGTNCAQGGGSSSGPITIMGYPGEDAYINDAYNATSGAGAIRAAGSARIALGMSAWITVTNLRIESGNFDGPVNTGLGGNNWRVINNELSAFSAINNVNAKAAGIAGNGSGPVPGPGQVFLGNYIHDVYCGPDSSASLLQHHGVYIDSTGNYEIAYNRFERIRGGSALSVFNNGTNGPSYTDNVKFHHNSITNTGKDGINIAAGARNNIWIWNNVVTDTDRSGIRFDSGNLNNAKIFNNTFVNSDAKNTFTSFAATMMSDSVLPTGQVEIRNNIFFPGDARRYYRGGGVGFNSVDSTMSNNVWFGGTGSINGASNVLLNPLFVDASGKNFRLSTSSPAIDTGSSNAAVIVTDDYDAATTLKARTLRPNGTGFDIGAFEK